MNDEQIINVIANSMYNSKIELSAKKSKGKDFVFEINGSKMELYVTYFLIGLYLKNSIDYSKDDLICYQKIAEHIFENAEKKYMD